MDKSETDIFAELGIDPDNLPENAPKVAPEHVALILRNISNLLPNSESYQSLSPEQRAQIIENTTQIADALEQGVSVSDVEASGDTDSEPVGKDGGKDGAAVANQPSAARDGADADADDCDAKADGADADDGDRDRDGDSDRDGADADDSDNVVVIIDEDAQPVSGVVYAGANQDSFDDPFAMSL